MDWTWSFDRYAAAAVSLGALAGGLAALGWWIWGGVWLLRRGWARAALLLPYGLCWSVGVAHRPGVVLLLFVAWLSLETTVPWIRAARGRVGTAPNPAAAAAALAGAVASAGALWLGPLPRLPAVLVSDFAGGLALLAFAAGAPIFGIVLWRRVLPSPVSRAAGGAALVLAFDGLYLTPGGLTVLLLGAPMLLQLARATANALRRRWAASGRRLAAACVWLMALAGLVAFSRFNLALSRSRSETVIEACRRYEKDQGHLPESLEALVPEYLPRVPRADWTALGSFGYSIGPDPELTYFAPWPAQVVYSFETGERHSREKANGAKQVEPAPRVDTSARRQLRASVRPTDLPSGGAHERGQAGRSGPRSGRR
jgi:hypothetical protein